MSNRNIVTSECKALWGEPEEVPSFAIVAHTVALHGIQTAQELVDMQTSDWPNTEDQSILYDCHDDCVYCVFVRAGAG